MSAAGNYGPNCQQTELSQDGDGQISLEISTTHPLMRPLIENSDPTDPTHSLFNTLTLSFLSLPASHLCHQGLG
jgi:hypothetical protein